MSTQFGPFYRACWKSFWENGVGVLLQGQRSCHRVASCGVFPGLRGAPTFPARCTPARVPFIAFLISLSRCPTLGVFFLGFRKTFPRFAGCAFRLNSRCSLIFLWGLFVSSLLRLLTRRGIFVSSVLLLLTRCGLFASSLVRLRCTLWSRSLR